MSKVIRAKASQNYVTNVVVGTCSNCSFSKDATGERLQYIDKNSYLSGTHTAIVPVALSCGVGDFAVKKSASCRLHQFKEST
jgi:hypothetical protein